jgi:hypothetical protein
MEKAAIRDGCLDIPGFLDEQIDAMRGDSPSDCALAERNLRRMAEAADSYNVSVKVKTGQGAGRID